NPHGDLVMTPVHNLHQGFSHVYVHFIFGPYYVFTMLGWGRTNEERQGLQKRKGILNLTAASVWEEEVC
ncbi:MAG: hypothetical protein WCB70_00990, partial [Xanthobacteraceae bacterium]